jgi:hypothetical protein
MLRLATVLLFSVDFASALVVVGVVAAQVGREYWTGFLPSRRGAFRSRRPYSSPLGIR